MGRQQFNKCQSDDDANPFLEIDKYNGDGLINFKNLQLDIKLMDSIIYYWIDWTGYW